MKVSYRIVEEVSPNGEWETVGVITLWSSDPPHLQLRAMLAHTVSRPIWKTIQQRVAEGQLTLQSYHEALEEYSHYYRIQPQIYDIEAQTANQIRHHFRQTYIFLDHTYPALPPSGTQQPITNKMRPVMA
jgi:3-dehydroquinate dehydratase